jgi:hypothetical protein
VILTGYLRRTLAPVPQPEVPVHLTAREVPMPRHPDVLVFGDWHPPGALERHGHPATET